MPEIRAVGMVSNSISATILRNVLARDGYDLREVGIILQRKLDLSWPSSCAEFIDYGVAPSLTLLGQVKTIGFYLRSARTLKRWLASDSIKDVYIVNTDNLLSNHVLQAARSGIKIRISVVTEGLMNYQDIGRKDRAQWRWIVKPIISKMLGLSYVEPSNHLSGSFEPEISRVFAYSITGLKSPIEKIVEVPFPKTAGRIVPDQNSALILLNGIGQWMSPARFEVFKRSFGRWVKNKKFDRIIVKQHPLYPSGGMEDVLPEHEVMTDNRTLEQMASEIPASTVIGYCTTGLVTLKLMRPDLHYIDWGSDFYCEHAYHGDFSIVEVLRDANIDIVRSVE